MCTVCLTPSLTHTTLTSALQSGSVIVLSSLAVTLIAANSIQTEASFTHLIAKQGTFICICKQAERGHHVTCAVALCRITITPRGYTHVV